MATQYHEYICTYIHNNNNGDAISLAQFLKDEVDFIASHTGIEEDYRSVWSSRFMKACKTLNVAPKRSKPEWGNIAMAILDKAADGASSSTRISAANESISSGRNSETHSTLSESTSTSASASASSSSSSSYGRKLSIIDRKRIAQMYDALDEEKMWTLSTGTKVESKMRQLAVQCNYEHPSHSLIMDPSDKMWCGIFSEGELKEIKSHNAPDVTALPVELDEFISTFNDKRELSELYDHACSFKFDPIKQPDLHWVHHSILQALDLLFCGYLDKERTEADLLRRVWSFIDTCFDMTNIDVLSGEKASKAASERVNNGRTLGAVDPMIRKKNGVKVDMLFSTARFELGSVEAGRFSDKSSTKSITESGFKCPKNLKDMLVEMESMAPSQLRNLKSCGFVIAGTFLQSLIMDCPAGHVARLNKLPNWLPYPIQANSFSAEFFSLIHIIWHVKVLMIEVEKVVKDNCRRPVLSYTMEQTQILTPCFVPTTNSSPSKRKYDVIE